MYVQRRKNVIREPSSNISWWITLIFVWEKREDTFNLKRIVFSDSNFELNWAITFYICESFFCSSFNSMILKWFEEKFRGMDVFDWSAVWEVGKELFSVDAARWMSFTASIVTCSFFRSLKTILARSWLVGYVTWWAAFLLLNPYSTSNNSSSCSRGYRDK
jgi:hypothetical protein